MKKLILTIIDGDEKTNIALEIDGMTLPEAIGRLEIEKAAWYKKLWHKRRA